MSKFCPVNNKNQCQINDKCACTSVGCYFWTRHHLNEVTPAVAEIRPKCIWYQMVKILKIALLCLWCVFHVSVLLATFLNSVIVIYGEHFWFQFSLMTREWKMVHFLFKLSAERNIKCALRHKAKFKNAASLILQSVWRIHLSSPHKAWCVTKLSHKNSNECPRTVFHDLRKSFTQCFVTDSTPKSANFPSGLFGSSCFLLRAKHKLRKGDCSLWEIWTWHDAPCYVIPELASPPEWSAGFEG